MSERCELSDLPVEQCACRVHGPQESAPSVPSSAFWARYPGVCPECDEEIEPGDMIRYGMDGRYVHAEC